MTGGGDKKNFSEAPWASFFFAFFYPEKGRYNPAGSGETQMINYCAFLYGRAGRKPLKNLMCRPFKGYT